MFESQIVNSCCSIRRDSLKLASRPALARRYPCDFTFYLGKSLSSIAGEYIDSLEERPVFPGEKSLRAMDAE